MADHANKAALPLETMEMDCLLLLHPFNPADYNTRSGAILGSG